MEDVAGLVVETQETQETGNDEDAVEAELGFPLGQPSERPRTPQDDGPPTRNVADNDDDSLKKDVEVEGDESDDEDDEEDSRPGPKKKTKTGAKSAGVRQCAKKNEVLYSNFRKCGHDSGGNMTCVCVHCELSFDKKWDLYLANRMPFKPARPKAVRQRPQFCRNHLAKCEHYKSYLKQARAKGPTADIIAFGDLAEKDLPESVSTNPQTPVSALSATSSRDDRKRGSTTGTLTDYYPRIMDAEQARIFNELTLEMIIDTHGPFNFVERESFHRLVNFLRPGSSQALVGRHALAGSRLNARYTDAIQRRDLNILGSINAGHYAAFLVDGWEMCNSDHVEGVMLKLGSRSFLLTALKGGADHDGQSTAREWEDNIFNSDHLATYNGRFKYFVTDEAGQCGRAKRILALRHPHVFFGKCWAHQVNLMVGHLFTETEYAPWVSKAISSASKVRKSSSKWYRRLQDAADAIYGKSVATTVLTLAETRWNSLQACLASLLRIRSACERLELMYRRDNEFPVQLQVWRDDQFWFKLEEAELLLRPFCDASFLLQRENNTMAEVVLVLLNLFLHVLQFVQNVDTANTVLRDLRRRWEDTEQPLFFLAFALHPSYRFTAMEIVRRSERLKGSWPNTNNKLCARRLAHAAKFYYDKYQLSSFEKDTREYRRELARVELDVFKWINNEMTGDHMLFEYNPNELDCTSDWYKVNEAVLGPAFTWFCMFLFDAPVQSASCERLFKDFARFHTKTRNRLSQEKLLKSTHIKYDLKEKYPSAALKKQAWHNTHKNRFVDPTEYDKTLESSVASSSTNKRSRNEDDADSDDDEEGLIDADIAAMATLYDAPLQQDLDVELRAILACLQSAVPAEDDEIFDANDQADADDMLLSSTQDSDDIDFDSMLARARLEQQDRQEDLPEKREGALQPIPMGNNPQFPQESKAYFRSKKYVRNDKYPFELLVFRSLDLPPVISAFGKKPS